MKNINYLFLIFLNILFIVNINGDCQTVLSKYFQPNSKHILTLTTIMNDGTVHYVRQPIYWFPNGGFLTNGDSWNAIASDHTECINGLIEPFGINRQATSFYDRSGIVIKQNGSVSFAPLWRPQGDNPYQFQLNCDDDKNIYHGTDQNNEFVFVFTDEKTAMGLPCK